MEESSDNPLQDQPAQETEAHEDENRDSDEDEDEDASEDPEEAWDRRENEDRIRSKIYREAMRWSIVNSIRRNCPSLVELAERKVAQIYRMAILEQLSFDIYEETDEAQASHLLKEALFNAQGYLHGDPNDSHMDEIIFRLNLARERELHEMAALQRAVVSIVAKRFPQLVELAKEQVPLADHRHGLEAIIPLLAVASDEKTARRILNKFPGYTISRD